jgi:hypothetical protein
VFALPQPLPILFFQIILVSWGREEKEIDTIVIMNILNKKALIRPPQSLYDAYNLSIMLPFITFAEDDTKLFEAKHEGSRTLLKVGFTIPEKHAPYIMD